MTLLLVTFVWIQSVTSITYYVNPSLSTGGIGTTWITAFNTLDTALVSANIPMDEIWLLGGFTYVPANPINRDDCFITKNDIIIFGGFDGSEANINQRDANTAASIISGDIGVINSVTDNCYHVIQYTQKLTLDNVIIQHGNANYQGDYATTTNVLHRYGGALITTDIGRPTFLHLNNVIIRNNTAINGGGIFVSSSPNNNVDVVIKDSTFEYNHAIDGEYEGGYGAAIYEMHLANVTLFNTEFNYNEALYRGGAIYQDYGALLYVDGCTFNDNKANGWGGAIFSEDRNSQTVGTFPYIFDSTFSNNFAGINGGAIFFYNGVIGTIKRNQFTSNIANGRGGAIALNNAQSTSTNNGFTTNIANSDSATNDEYDETAFSFASIDDILTFNITQELHILYNKWNNMLDESDLYPFNLADSLCYIDIDNNNVNKDGSSWTTAYNNIQECLEDLKINGGEIWVKKGIYIPTTIPDWKQRIGKSTNMHLSFSMYDNIRIYGGFDGTENNRNQRNWRDNPTYLSCQVTNRVQCNQIINAADETLIDGFIFINAGTGVSNPRRLANSISVSQVLSSTASNPGAGIYTNSTTISVVNSIFYKLFTTGKGGAVYCIGLQGGTGISKSPTFINVAFLGNRANARGGAISADVECNFICKECKFDSNSCGKKGGAVYLDFDCDPIFNNSIFNNNYAMESGGCIAADGKSYTMFNGINYFNSNYAEMEGGCLYSGSGVGLNIDQGFMFQQQPNFINNYMLHANIGQNNAYGWPYSKFKINSIEYTSQPTISPTPAPISTVPHTQPNIIIFLIDDIDFTQHWNQSAPTGVNLNGKNITYFDYPTPYIDEFMKESVVFPNAFCGGPKCAPSRFTILTGRQTVRSAWAIEKSINKNSYSGYFGTNVTIQTSKIYYNDSIYNIQNVLKNNGYYTGMVGKYHLLSSSDNGYNYGCNALSKTQDTILYEQCINVVKQSGFNFVDAWYYSNIDINSYFSHNPEWMVSQSQKFINYSLNVLKQPFFLYFASTLTHTPSIEDALNSFTMYDSPKGTLTGDDIPDDTRMNSRSVIWTRALSHGNSIKTEKYASHYWVDESFGALINYLKINNIYDNTLIVLMNDHGMQGKGLLYLQGSKIIHFVRYPPLFGDNGPEILPNDFVISNTDLAAVIFQVTNINPPIKYKLDGISWVNDVIDQINNPFINTQTCCQYRYIDVFNSHSIVNDKYQYIYRQNPNLIETDQNVGSLYPNTYDEEQIYNIIHDPNQKINQISNISLCDTIVTFQTLMRQYISDTCPINLCKMPDLICGTISPTSNNPTISPTNNPTNIPSEIPTFNPSNSPSNIPSKSPTYNPSITPTNIPTITPTFNPSNSPTLKPTKSPLSGNQTHNPTNIPTIQPSANPTISPTIAPTNPTINPTNPTVNPTISPTNSTINSTIVPSNKPTSNPGIGISISPTNNPSELPTENLVTNIISTQLESKESKQESNKTGTIIYVIIVLIIFICFIILMIIGFKWYKNKKDKITYSKPNVSTPIKDNNVQMSHMIVPSSSILELDVNTKSSDIEDNNTLRATNVGTHLSLPSASGTNV